MVDGIGMAQCITVVASVFLFIFCCVLAGLDIARIQKERRERERAFAAYMHMIHEHREHMERWNYLVRRNPETSRGSVNWQREGF